MKKFNFISNTNKTLIIFWLVAITFFITNTVFATTSIPEMTLVASSTPSGTSTSSPIFINLSVVYPDDLIYDGSAGSVGLTLEPLLNMKWWGVVVHTETDNFISECVSTASPLPTASFDLWAGDYKTSISLAETKADCEAFNQNEYPLFAVLEAANFAIAQ